jgi:hypothetical protein
MYLPAFFLASNVCKCSYKCTWKDKASWHLTTMLTVRKARDIYCFPPTGSPSEPQRPKARVMVVIDVLPRRGAGVVWLYCDGSFERVSGTGCSIAGADQLRAYLNSSCRNAAFICTTKPFHSLYAGQCRYSTLGYLCRLMVSAVSLRIPEPVFVNV